MASCFLLKFPLKYCLFVVLYMRNYSCNCFCVDCPIIFIIFLQIFFSMAICFKYANWTPEVSYKIGSVRSFVLLSGRFLGIGSLVFFQDFGMVTENHMWLCVKELEICKRNSSKNQKNKPKVGYRISTNKRRSCKYHILLVAKRKCI